MKKLTVLFILTCALLFLTACNQGEETAQTTQENTVSQSETDSLQEETTQMSQMNLVMTVNGVEVDVQWEKNDAVNDLISLSQNEEIVVNTTLYGGFEQVGVLPESLASKDTQMTAVSGDIMLYNSNQLVLFFGENSWSYTKLGHISGLSSDEITQMLNKDSAVVTVNIKN